MRRAIVFWACREQHYIRAARCSACSAKAHMPDVETVLLTDQDRQWKQFDLTITVPRPAKEDVCFPPLSLLPTHYDTGMYVGSEAHFCAPLYDVFELVEGGRVDIALVHTSGKRYVDCKFDSPEIPDAFPHWRSALVAFRHHERTRQFFALWAEEFERLKWQGLRGGIRYPDQPALRSALYKSDLCFVTLPPNYCCTGGDALVRNTVRLLAYHENANPEQLAREVNRHAPGARLLVEGKSRRL